MKKFDLNEYLKNPGRKIVTKDGKSVKIICTDRSDDGFPIVALVGETAIVYCYTKEGRHFCSYSDSNDLFFASENKKGWINVYAYESPANTHMTGYIFPSKDKAISNSGNNLVDTIEIEWEE